MVKPPLTMMYRMVDELQHYLAVLIHERSNGKVKTGIQGVLEKAPIKEKCKHTLKSRISDFGGETFRKAPALGKL